VPKTLDPAVSYGAEEHIIIGNVYDTLLEYHYLDRPYRLIPGLAEAVPEARPLPDGRQAYRFKIRQGILFHADPCFTRSQNGSQTREVIAADFAFALARVADPRPQQPGDQQLRADRGLCRLRQAARRVAPHGRRLRRPAGA
jgi:ABC-type transport system substrate-binding protein